MANCETCAEKKKQEVPYIVHEADMARMERTNKRFCILCVILVILLAASWGGFIWYESQFELVTETTQEVWQETDDGDNRFVGGDYYGDSARQDYD